MVDVFIPEGSRRLHSQGRGPTRKSRDYTIQRGDTLGEIAKASGTNYEDLASFNGIENPDMIDAGANLRVPEGFDLNELRRLKDQRRAPPPAPQLRGLGNALPPGMSGPGGLRDNLPGMQAGNAPLEQMPRPQPSMMDQVSRDVGQEFDTAMTGAKQAGGLGIALGAAPGLAAMAGGGAVGAGIGGAQAGLLGGMTSHAMQSPGDDPMGALGAGAEGALMGGLGGMAGYGLGQLGGAAMSRMAPVADDLGGQMRPPGSSPMGLGPGPSARIVGETPPPPMARPQTMIPEMMPPQAPALPPGFQGAAPRPMPGPQQGLLGAGSPPPNPFAGRPPIRNGAFAETANMRSPMAARGGGTNVLPPAQAAAPMNSPPMSAPMVHPTPMSAPGPGNMMGDMPELFAQPTMMAQKQFPGVMESMAPPPAPALPSMSAPPPNPGMGDMLRSFSPEQMAAGGLGATAMGMAAGTGISSLMGNQDNAEAATPPAPPYAVPRPTAHARPDKIPPKQNKEREYNITPEQLLELIEAELAKI